MMTSGRTLVRNTLLNLTAQVVPLIVAIVSVPVLLHALGKERFGILTMAWAAIGYFSLFDLGLSRALTQAVSASIGNGGDDRELGELSMSALAWMAALGVVGGLVFAALTPWLIGSGLNVPLELQEESRIAFFLMSASLPFVVVTAGLRGLLEAHQHFGLATALRLPYATLMFVGPLLVLPWTRSVAAVVATLVAGRILLFVAHVIACRREYPFLRGARPSQARAVAGLLRIGGWMTVSNVVSPMMVSLDRFLIAGMLSLAAVSYYVTSFEITIKLLLIPGAVLGVFFPAFAETHESAPQRASDLYDGTMRTMLFLTFPGVLALVVFAHEILTAWVGAEMAAGAAMVMRIMAIGVFVNGLGQVSFAALQGMGRADLTAKLHIVELPLYTVAMLLLARAYGLTGVAVAWTGRIVLDTALLAWLMRRRVAGGEVATARVITYLVVLTGATVAAAAPQGFAARLALVTAIVLIGIPLAWYHGLRDRERAFIGGLLRLPARWVPESS